MTGYGYQITMYNDMNELISVIIPVYKVEAYLPDCVESVLGQTYQNFELILVDDGSPDNCPQMCDAFVARDARIRVIHKENGGLSSARNAGIEAARGDYLAFLDSDDLWSPLFLNRLYRAIQEVDADFSVCLFRRFSDSPPADLPETADTEKLTQQDAFECLFHARNENMVVAPNKLYRRKLFESVRYPVGQIHEDEAVIHEIIGGAKTVAWVNEVHYYYRLTPDSITNAKFSLKRLDEMKAKERRIAWFEAHNMQGLADCTRIVYLNNLMRLYRTVQAELADRKEAQAACRMIYDRFCELYTPELTKGQSIKAKLRYRLFQTAPRLFSRIEYARLKRKGII